MFLDLPKVLTVEEVERLRSLADSARFADGRLSSPHSTVKNNLQIDHGDPDYAESTGIMVRALQRCERFADFAFPRVMAPPMLAKYGPGMNYGVHSDAPFMPIGRRPLRSDLSCTLWIADPASYEGGELLVRLGDRAVTFKGAQGSAIVYPSNTLHEVLAVTSGERLVGLTFIESRIPDLAHRNLLFNLNEVAALEGLKMEPENRIQLQYVRDNLQRMWSEAG